MIPKVITTMLEKPGAFDVLDYDVPQTRPIRMKQELQAKALYENVADTPDELSFKKGDILTVIEQDTKGFKGWWLCILRDRQGLCPGNRLRILNSYDSGCFSMSPVNSPCPSPHLNSSICSADIYENTSIMSNGSGSSSGPRSLPLPMQSSHCTRRSWHVSPNKVITPQRHGDVYRYTVPTPTTSTYSLSQLPSQQQQQIYSNQSVYQNLPAMACNGDNSSRDFETYDVPKPAASVNYDCPKNVCRTPTLQAALRGCATPIQEESYDVPRPLNSLLHHQNTLTPSSSNSSLLNSESLSLSFSSSNRSSLANMPDYDIPRRNPVPVRAVHQLAQQSHQQLTRQQQYSMNGNSNGSITCYDFTPSTPVQEKPAANALLANTVTKELPLELTSALETLAKLQTETATAIIRLLSFVSPSWRKRNKLEPLLMEVRLAAVRLRTALHDLTEFGEGALGNATRSEDRNLALKLRPLVRALRDADKLIHESTDVLDAQGWTLDQLERSDDKASFRPPDSLDQLIACAQTLIEDVRQITSFIQGNASLLFRRACTEVATPSEPNGAANGAVDGSNNTNSGEWLEDYDYVSFESKDVTAKKNSALREAIPANLKNKFDTALKAAENTAVAAAANAHAVLSPPAAKGASELTDKDKTLVRYYAVQICTHMGNLRQAIDSFFETVEKNQPPRYFIAYGKFVVVSAHNLVTIGDIVHRNISKAELREKILRSTDALSDALKTCVAKSKKAATHFPSVTAVQEMVDSVAEISQLSAELKKTILQTVQLTL